MPRSYDLSELSLGVGSEILALLHRCPGVEPVRFADGEYLMREGERGTDAYLVLSGAFVVEQPHDEALDAPPSTLAIVEPEGPEQPTFVGEMAHLGGLARSASVRSSFSTETLKLDAAALDVLIEELPSLTRVLCRQLAERLAEANRVIRQLEAPLAMSAQRRRLEPGARLIERGAAADTLYQLVIGALVNEDSGAAIVPQGDPCWIEPATFLRRGRWDCSVRAESPSLLVAIDGGSREAFVRNHPELALSLIERAAEGDE